MTAAREQRLAEIRERLAKLDRYEDAKKHGAGVTDIELDGQRITLAADVPWLLSELEAAEERGRQQIAQPLLQMQGEIIPVYNDEYVPLSWVRDVIQAASRTSGVREEKGGNDE